MITKIGIKNFKSLQDIELECSNLNLLTGKNGMGKSSIIQTLLLLRQSNDKGFLKRNGLTLNGDLIDIGTGKDAFYQYATSEIMSFNLAFGNLGEYQWNFGYSTNNEIEERSASDSDVMPYAIPPEERNLFEFPLFTYNFKYLSAERWVKNQYEMSEYEIRDKRSFGKNGQFAAHFLAQFGLLKNENVDDALIYPGTTVNTLDYQVSAWMNEISPGSIVKAEKILGANSVKLRYQFKNSQGTTNEFLPTNVGFGMTYAFPIIVSLLSSKPGDILVFENPESHLHPTGQSAIGRLMAKVSHLGVQIFAETHSDHIVNGILVDINRNYRQKKPDISDNRVKIYFIEREHDESFAQVQDVKFTLDGKIKHAPVGFFDQFSKDLKTIIGF